MKIFNRARRRRRQGRREAAAGFTLLELLVVLVILALLGVGMMWFLAFKMEMSTIPDTEIEAIVDDIGDTAEEQVQRI